MDRRSFFLGAGALVISARAGFAQSAALMVLSDKVTAGRKSVPEGVNRLVTFAYDEGKHPTRGGAQYRLSDADETARYPAEAWFKSANGRYFLLAESPASPLMFGAIGDGETNDAAAIAATRDFCVASAAPMLIDTYFAHVGTLALNDPISIRGVGRERCGLYLAIDREHEGINVLASGVAIEDLEVRAHIPEKIQNGQGSYGTCITVGATFPSPARTDGKLVEPRLVMGTVLSRLKLTRAEGSASAHALACIGRISGVTGNDIQIEGFSPRHSHGNAILIHWATSGKDFPLDKNGIAIKPYVLQKDPDSYTYHPNNIRFENLRVRNTGRLAAISSAYAINISKVDFDGLDDGVAGNGSQLLDLVVGDEGDRFAHPDDMGKVYSNISLTDVIAYNITGSGINARAVIDCSGFGTSKYEDDPNTGERYKEQPSWKNIEIANVLIEADLSDTTELVNVRNFLGDITFRDVHAKGKVSQGGFRLQQCDGLLRFQNCTVSGRTLIEDCDGLSMQDCRLVGSMFPIIALKLASSEGFVLGEDVKGRASGAVGKVAAIPDKATVRVQLESWISFTEGEDLIGSTTRAIVAAASVSNATLMIAGGTSEAILASDIVQDATEIMLSSDGDKPGFPDAVKIGDKIAYDGGILYVKRYAPANTALIEVSSAPARLKAGGRMALERRSRNLQFLNCDISGSSRGVDARDCYNVAFEGGRIRDTGQYGLLVAGGSEVSMTGTAFSNNGLRRLLPRDASLPTRDVAVAESAIFDGRGLRFEDSGHVLHNVAVNPGASGGSLEDCLFAGAPIEASLSIPKQLNGASRFVVQNNRNINGKDGGD